MGWEHAREDRLKKLGRSQNRVAKDGKIDIYTKYQMNSIKGEGQLESINVKNDDKETKTLKTDYVLGFFGLIMQLGPIANWGLNLDKKTIEVDTEKFETNQKGIYACLLYTSDAAD